MPKRIVIIGAHAAAVDASSAARKTDRTAEITLITEEKNAGYSRCGLPFVIGHKIPDFKSLIVFPPAFYQMMKLTLKTETKVTAINTTNKTIDTSDKTGKNEIVAYDSLIVATGASPFMPPIKGREKPGILSLRTLEDGARIDKMIQDGAKTAVIMGGGLIGLELAIGLQERGVKSTVVEMLPQILPQMLDAEMAKDVQTMLEEKGISIHTGKCVEEILGQEKATSIAASGEHFQGDLIISAFGVRANTQLAVNASITLGELKAIKTNARMETCIKDVYAVGDCAETTHIVTQKPACPQLGTVAVRQGKVAGHNAAGRYSLFTGVLGSAVTRLFTTDVGVTGLTEAAAQRQRIDTVTGTIASKTKAEYYPGALPIKVKLVVEKESQRIIGAQIIGGEEVSQRINAMSLAIQKQMTAFELAKADTGYAPPVCETWEPLVLAAEMAMMKLR
jgi:NADH oxidase (H2O2-forming)